MRGVSGRGLGLLGTAWARGRGEGEGTQRGDAGEGWESTIAGIQGGRTGEGRGPPFLRDAGEVGAETEADLVC